MKPNTPHMYKRTHTHPNSMNTMPSMDLNPIDILHYKKPNQLKHMLTLSSFYGIIGYCHGSIIIGSKCWTNACATAAWPCALEGVTAPLDPSASSPLEEFR